MYAVLQHDANIKLKINKSKTSVQLTLIEQMLSWPV